MNDVEVKNILNTRVSFNAFIVCVYMCVQWFVISAKSLFLVRHEQCPFILERKQCENHKKNNHIDTPHPRNGSKLGMVVKLIIFVTYLEGKSQKLCNGKIITPYSDEGLIFVFAFPFS